MKPLRAITQLSIGITLTAIFSIGISLALIYTGITDLIK